MQTLLARAAQDTHAGIKGMRDDRAVAIDVFTGVQGMDEIHAKSAPTSLAVGRTDARRWCDVAIVAGCRARVVAP